MKVVALNGSPNADGNTYTSLKAAAEELLNAGIEVEILNVGNQAVRGCLACRGCFRNKNEECVIKTDCVNEYVQKMKQADGIIIGSPVYYSGVNGTMKSFLDRAFYVAGSNGNLFRHKVGASVAAVRRSGGVATFDQLNHYFLIGEMVVVSGNYWSVVHGTAKGEALQDTEGIQTMRVMAKNMAWVLKLMEAGKGNVNEPEPEAKEMMNFIH